MATSLWATIVARIKSRMESITRIGLVHDRQRFVLGETGYSDVAEVIIGPGHGELKVRLWTIALDHTDTKAADSSGRMQWNRSVVIDGWFQIEDANSSELVAQGLAETVIRVLWADIRGTRLNESILSGQVPQLQYVRPEFYGPIPCHHVRIVIPLMTIEDAP